MLNEKLSYMRQEGRLMTILLLSFLIICSSGAFGNTPAMIKPKVFSASSPDGKTLLKVTVGDGISYQIESGGLKIIEPSKIAMTLSDGTRIPGANPSVKSENLKTVNNTISTTVYKKSVVTDRYNPLVLTFREGYSVEFRVYDDGIAYRFHTKF